MTNVDILVRHIMSFMIPMSGAAEREMRKLIREMAESHLNVEKVPDPWEAPND